MIYMTANQIAYARLLEEKRTHQVGEKETQRHNVAQEEETKRANTLNSETSKRNTDVQVEASKRNVDVQTATNKELGLISSETSRYAAGVSAGASTYGSQLNYQVGMANVAETQRHNETAERTDLAGKIMNFATNVAKWITPTLAK